MRNNFGYANCFAPMILFSMRNFCLFVVFILVENITEVFVSNNGDIIAMFLGGGREGKFFFSRIVAYKMRKTTKGC